MQESPCRKGHVGKAMQERPPLLPHAGQACVTMLHRSKPSRTLKDPQEPSRTLKNPQEPSRTLKNPTAPGPHHMPTSRGHMHMPMLMPMPKILLGSDEVCA